MFESLLRVQKCSREVVETQLGKAVRRVLLPSNRMSDFFLPMRLDSPAPRISTN